MSTIHDLPLEIIGRIINGSFSIVPESDDGEEERRYFLLDASLVCRDWKQWAQPELWKVAKLYGNSLSKFDAAGPGRYPVKMLGLDAWGERDGGAGRIEAILRAVRGVHALEVHAGSIDTSWLCGPGLKDLKVLDLHRGRYSCQIPPSLPFNLHMLKLTLYDRPSPDLVHALSQQLSITSLRLASNEPATVESLLPLAPRLLILDASGRTDFKVFFSKCTRLNALTVDEASIPDVECITNPLQSLKVNRVQEPDLALILDLLNSKATAVGGLERLTVNLYEGYLESLSEEEALEWVKDWNQWPGVAEVCRQKKIKLVVTGDDEQCWVSFMPLDVS